MDPAPNVDPLAERARHAKPSVLRIQTNHQDPEVRAAAAAELDRRAKEMAERKSLTGVVHPL